MDVAFLKAQLASARYDIQSKDEELALLDAELQSKLRLMEVAPEEGPAAPFVSTPPRTQSTASDSEPWRPLALSGLEAEMAEMRVEAQQQEARLAAQLAGLSAGARALASQLAHEREERLASIARVQQELEERLQAVCGEDVLALLADVQVALVAQQAQSQDLRAALAGLEAQRLQPAAAEAAAPPPRAAEAERADLCADLALHIQRQESYNAALAQLKQDVEDTCGHLCAEVLALRARLDVLSASHAEAAEAKAAGPFGQGAEVPTHSALADDVQPMSARDVACCLRQLEKEVPLLAKAIISGSQELTVRLGEERAMRLAAEAALEVRIQHVEDKVSPERPCDARTPLASLAHMLGRFDLDGSHSAGTTL